MDNFFSLQFIFSHFSRRYAVEKLGFYATKKKSGLGITFDNVVEQTISELQIGPKTLLVRFGGIIGVGKNLLWILVFSATSVGALITFIKRKKKFEDNQT